MCIKKLVILAILFAIVASPMTYGITRDIFGSWVASPSGCASGGGVLLHAVVFAGVLFVMWKLSKKVKMMEGLSPLGGSRDGRVSKKRNGSLPAQMMMHNGSVSKQYTPSSMGVPPMTRMMMTRPSRR